MSDNDFGFEWDPMKDAAEKFTPSPQSNSVDALETWLENNYQLWELGMRLATAAQQYRREYVHVPFNQNGWFCPN